MGSSPELDTTSDFSIQFNVFTIGLGATNSCLSKFQDMDDKGSAEILL